MIRPDLLSALIAAAFYQQSIQSGGDGGGGSGSGGQVVTLKVGDYVWWPVPAGLVATVNVQRNGVDVPTLLDGYGLVKSTGTSNAAVGAFQYRVVAEDIGTADNPVTLTARLSSVAFETNAPRLYSIDMPIEAPNTIRKTFDENLDPSSVPAAGAFTVGGTLKTAKTATAVSIAGNVVTTTYDSVFAPTDVIVETYTPGANPLRDLAHVKNAAPAYAAYSVWNRYDRPAELIVLRSDEPRYVVGGGGFVNTQPTDFYGITRPTLLSLSAGDASIHDWSAILVDQGWVEMQIVDADAAVRAIGIGGQAYLPLIAYGVRLSGGTVQAYSNDTAVIGTAYHFASPSALCRARVYRHMPSGTVTFDTSEDGGAVWTTRYTWPTPFLYAEAGGIFVSRSGTVAIVGAALQGFTTRGYLDN